MTDFTIRTTELEDFVMCPYYYANKNSIEKEMDPEKKAASEKAKSTWTKLHRSLQSYLSGKYNPVSNLWERNQKSLEILEPELDEKEIKYVNSCVNLADRHNLPNFLVTESEYKTTLVVWDDNLLVSGHVDWLVDVDYMVDIKTAKSKRQESALKYKLQWKMYPVLYALARYPEEKLNDIEMKFDYWIFTKQVTPQFQWFRLNVNVWEYYWEIKRIAREYIQAKKTNSYCTNIGSPACFRCPLKRAGECPAYFNPVKESGWKNNQFDEIISWL